MPEAEQLLELIDHDQQVGARLEQLALFHRFDQAEAAAVERGEQTRQGAGVFPIVEIGLDEGPRQVLDRAAAGPKNHHLPGRAGLGHGAAIKLGDHAGPHQRRLAAARGADDRQESVGSQQLEQSGSLLLAAEEEVVLVAAKRAQAGKRIGPLEVHCPHRSLSSLANRQDLEIAVAYSHSRGRSPRATRHVGGQRPRISQQPPEPVPHALIPHVSCRSSGEENVLGRPGQRHGL